MNGNVMTIALGAPLLLSCWATNVPSESRDLSTWDLDRHPEEDARRYLRDVAAINRFMKRWAFRIGLALILIGLIGVVLEGP